MTALSSSRGSSITTTRPTSRLGRRRGFTITELLIVIALIVVLLSLLLPALGGVWSAGQMTKSMNNMRQIGTWMGLYSGDNDDYIVPSRFDYSADGYAGKVRSYSSPQIGQQSSGSWTDVLQTVFKIGAYPDALVSLGHDYGFDSPDLALYDLIGDDAVVNPFRSAAPNSRDYCGDDGSGRELIATPFGQGAKEVGQPGYLAANNFFDAGWVNVPAGGRFYTNGQIRIPDQSMYLVDSYVGETIENTAAAYDSVDNDCNDGKPDWDVDFRYGNNSTLLMLFMDAHVATETKWEDIEDLESRRVRVCRLDERKSCPPK